MRSYSCRLVDLDGRLLRESPMIEWSVGELRLALFALNTGAFSEYGTDQRAVREQINVLLEARAQGF
jgi:hypothetical protein